MNPLSFFFVNLVDRAVAEILALFASFNKSYSFCNPSNRSYAPTVLYRTCHACVSPFSLRLWVWSFGDDIAFAVKGVAYLRVGAVCLPSATKTGTPVSAVAGSVRGILAFTQT
jgi:hypothetical protein